MAGDKYEPHTLPSGAVRQSAVEKGETLGHVGRAFGMNNRGVVVKLYPRDTPPPGSPDPASTYADVLLYGKRRQVIPRVQVPQAFGSPHTGVVGGLRAATMSAGAPIADIDHIDPATLDGSHVAVSYFDDDLGQPFISAILEHPRADGGGSISGPVEDRARLSSTDGRPLLLRWNGATVGFTAAGDILIDIENAHDGALIGTGEEPPPPTNGSAGNARVRVAQGAKLIVTVGGGAACTFELAGATAKMTLGDGAYSVAVAEHLRAQYAALVDWIYNQLIVQTAMGPSAPPATAGAPPAPEWDEKIVSTKLKLPDT